MLFRSKFDSARTLNDRSVGLCLIESLLILRCEAGSKRCIDPDAERPSINWRQHLRDLRHRYLESAEAELGSVMVEVAQRFPINDDTRASRSSEQWIGFGHYSSRPWRTD